MDWKEKWFYIENHAPALPSRTLGIPKWRGEWIQKSPNLFQVKDLLDRIKDLRAENQTGASVVMSWMGRRIQPFQQRSHFGFYYRGIQDPSRFSSDKISEDEAVHRVCRVLDGVFGVPALPDTFSIKDPPKDVSESH